MLAARIKLGEQFTSASSDVSAHFTENSGKLTLHIDIEVNEDAFFFADDGDGTDEPEILEGFRDARLGSGLLTIDNLQVANITQPNPAQGGSNLTINATIRTKIPGTGVDFAALALRQARPEEEAYKH